MKKEKKLPEAKIVVIGDTGVGKSSITSRYVYDKFDYNQESTLGAAYMEKVCKIEEDKAIKLQIWDTAGQEKYLAIAKLYYRDCRVAVLVYDVTRAQSFADLRKWASEIDKHAPKHAVKMVVGNKIDLIGSGLSEEVPESEVRKFTEEIGGHFMTVSAKDNQKIQELFVKLAREVAPYIEKLAQKSLDVKKSVLRKKDIRAEKKCC